jgi:hypothetical protein
VGEHEAQHARFTHVDRAAGHRCRYCRTAVEAVDVRGQARIAKPSGAIGVKDGRYVVVGRRCEVHLERSACVVGARAARQRAGGCGTGYSG